MQPFCRWNWRQDLQMELLCVRWMIRQWMLKCPENCQELRNLYAVRWRVPMTESVDISTTCQQSRNRVNSIVTDRPISTSQPTASITMTQVYVITFIMYKFSRSYTLIFPAILHSGNSMRCEIQQYQPIVMSLSFVTIRVCQLQIALMRIFWCQGWWPLL